MGEGGRLVMLALAGATAAYLCLLGLRAGLSLSYARRMDEVAAAPLQTDALTVVQPILSGDPLLESRLAANLSALPDQRFLWLVDQDDAEAIRVAGVLRGRFPAAGLEAMVCPPCPEKTNPKLWKLRDAAAVVRTRYFGVLDDDSVLTAASAAALAGQADTHTVATGLPCYEASADLPSGLLAQFVNNNSVFTYLGTSRLLAPFTLNGMAYVLQCDRLPELGDFNPILGELTDDLALATLVLKRGGAICQTTAAVRVRSDVDGFGHYMRFMHRWYLFTLLLMRRQSTGVKALIFLLHGLPPLLLLAIVIMALSAPGIAAAGMVGGLLVMRSLVISAMLRRFFGGGLHHPVVSLLSELMQPLHLVHAMACRTIRWRTRRYLVRDTGDFSNA